MKSTGAETKSQKEFESLKTALSIAHACERSADTAAGRACLRNIAHYIIMQVTERGWIPDYRMRLHVRDSDTWRAAVGVSDYDLFR